jgi:hypothetical protein
VRQVSFTVFLSLLMATFVCIGFVLAIVMGRRGHSPFGWGVLGLVLGPIALLLALGRRGPCVSVFLPTHRAGREVEQAPIRLKNLLRQATDVLKSHGVRAPEIDRLLAPLRGLLDDRLFWQYQSDGLAPFSRPGWWRSFRVPLNLPELAVVDDYFHVTPLVPLLAGDGHFFVLALSQNQIRLLEGTRDRVEEVDLPGVPWGFGMPPGRGGPKAAAAVCRRPRRPGRRWHLPRPGSSRRGASGAGPAVLPEGGSRAS